MELNGESEKNTSLTIDPNSSSYTTISPFNPSAALDPDSNTTNPALNSSIPSTEKEKTKTEPYTRRMKGAAQPYEENIRSGAGCLQPSWGSKLVSQIINTLIDMGRKMATFITVTTLWITVGLVTIMLMPRQVGFAMLFVASLCLRDEDMQGGLQVRYHVQCFLMFFFAPLPYR